MLPQATFFVTTANLVSSIQTFPYYIFVPTILDVFERIMDPAEKRGAMPD